MTRSTMYFSSIKNSEKNKLQCKYFQIIDTATTFVNVYRKPLSCKCQARIQNFVYKVNRTFQLLLLTGC